MAALDFPASPTIGQTANGGRYVWNGTGWLRVRASTVPEAPTDGKIYSRKNAAWVEAVTNLPRSAISSGTTLVAGDQGKLIDCTAGTFTLEFSAAATLGNGWWDWW